MPLENIKILRTESELFFYFQDVHASVYFYRDWIRNVMSGNSKCTGFSSNQS